VALGFITPNVDPYADARYFNTFSLGPPNYYTNLKSGNDIFGETYRVSLPWMPYESYIMNVIRTGTSSRYLVNGECVCQDRPFDFLGERELHLLARGSEAHLKLNWIFVRPLAEPDVFVGPEEDIILLQHIQSIGVDTGISTENILSSGSPHPNPFLESTDIPYTLSTESEISLKIYDVAGRSVRTLESGVRPRGDHRVTWDGTNDEGFRVKPGIYFVLLRSQGFSVGHAAILR
jgi:hypothetical protein